MGHSNSAESLAHQDVQAEKGGGESQGDVWKHCRQDAFGDKAPGCAKETLAKAENGDNKFLDIPPLDYKGKTMSAAEQSKDGTTNDGGYSKEVQEKLDNRPEVKDAQEFQRKFGKNPNSPEAIAWLQQKIGEHVDQEVKE
ncbi:MAG: hypothetical protein JSS86_01700, partial [Cyanobacteria bacterium SZAS LIN-2]|nr:hypothetical protein [Cyanobacteria bacterium SZAS LIN-2]